MIADDDECFDANHNPPPPVESADAVETVPWAMIEPGRYQPRRIRGSCLGRELG